MNDLDAFLQILEKHFGRKKNLFIFDSMDITLLSREEKIDRILIYFKNNVNVMLSFIDLTILTVGSLAAIHQKNWLLFIGGITVAAINKFRENYKIVHASRALLQVHQRVLEKHNKSVSNDNNDNANNSSNSNNSDYSNNSSTDYQLLLKEHEKLLLEMQILKKELLLLKQSTMYNVHVPSKSNKLSKLPKLPKSNKKQKTKL